MDKDPIQPLRYTNKPLAVRLTLDWGCMDYLPGGFRCLRIGATTERGADEQT